VLLIEEPEPFVPAALVVAPEPPAPISIAYVAASR
jgi:hypothetical protein